MRGVKIAALLCGLLVGAVAAWGVLYWCCPGVATCVRCAELRTGPALVFVTGLALTALVVAMRR